ncbi:MAG: tilS [Deltaproteobacteria bacterium]|nr:tilS [Deltaproteobacteria bacterium]
MTESPFRMRKIPDNPPVVAAVSGGPDSMFLLENLARGGKRKILVAHVNHGMRGRESAKDEKLVKEASGRLLLELRIKKEKPGRFHPGFEEKAREIRRGFLKGLSKETGGGVIAMGHTADDQVETVLMRFFEGAGIAGLKGIPRETADGIVRPILDVWKEDILKYLKQNKISFRVDRSNLDLRFERNWIRNVVLPLLVERYGKEVKKRIFTLGERFRELNDYLESQAGRWIRRNVKETAESFAFRRTPFSGLPAFLRVRILQKICFRFLGTSPNERLLAAMDKTIRAGKPSNRLNIGNGWELTNRYEEVRFVPSGKPGMRTGGSLRTVEMEHVTPARAKRVAARGDAEVFDAEALRFPLHVRPLRRGDRIRPFGQRGEKKLKEILIDRKVPREERWGRPAVCDSEGRILWIPGVVRSAHAPVTSSTKCAKILSYFK